jgi:transcriptional regulator with XRE-family HTH domain
MMMTDNMALLRKAVACHGQAKVARQIGYSPSAVSQALKGSYGSSLDRLLMRVAEVYGNGTVQCPVMGEIPLKRCAEERRKPFGVSSPQRVQLFRACQVCEARRTL